MCLILIDYYFDIIINCWRSMEKQNRQNQQHFNQAQKHFKYYKKEELQSKGVFDMRFDSIKNSLINQNFFKQGGNAISFQFNKWWNTKKQIYQVKKLNKEDFVNEKNKIKVTWIGHATVLLTFGTKINILIDPIFDTRVTPFQAVPFGGEKRLAECPCSVNSLPPINCIFISHDHFDHLDYQAIQKIAKINQKTDNFTIITGKNMKQVFPKICHNCVTQLSWTQTKIISLQDHQFKITFAPACHWCKRNLFDQNHRLWGGFVIQSQGFKTYFSGDTGFDN